MPDGVFLRQSFLGEKSESIFRDARVAIVGLGGGGSHIAQQLAHIGVGRFLLIDPDIMELKNLNRTVGGRRIDPILRRRKIKVSRRLIKGINPCARVRCMSAKWEEVGDALRGTDAIFGCLDGFKERCELETMARRYHIPYFDIGMDVHEIGASYAISGQVIVSLPGQACMRCMRFLSDKKLAEEAGKYGAAGNNPQVIWPNGVLASVAVGTFVKVFTPWCTTLQTSTYLEYEGNSQALQVSNRLLGVNLQDCQHFSSDSLGDPFWKK
jgi:hypothetical protein